MSAGAGIKAIRTGMDLSVRELGRLAGVEPGYLSRVERGRTPSDEWLRRVTDALAEHLSGAA